ncbi:glutamate and aspartate transporter subunit; periplasmic-binding component of ABC superfamily(Extracellular solute-binding protein, family 3,36-265) [Magnetospirillum sp. XM-1]|uniref:amino acid ABC transporter substrate-binding protein n=1 Tax=Magnetospirillum sp. XM-1 TaxID=1663591 RepID=UPI00073DB7DE|nr:amino acid ABC transporter substrate-binding protein [Magnetospirillum sp. XM-1]CUW38647.1 glutamate and aspartate transporter subunit; periplasmic-binding component of ABC superfamily(Extracellular solute-binding protein, family 3,36-265) [Magnetospirillum sp. XM-1]
MNAIRTLLLLALALVPAAAQAGPEATLDKVKRSGTLVLGVREASYPLSYLDGAKQPIGYHVDICRSIAEAVKTRLGLAALDVRTEVVTSKTRIPRMVEGAIDLECGSTTNNAARQAQVAFAPTTYVASVRIAVKKSAGISKLAQLDGKAVVTTAGSTSVQLLKARVQGRNIKVTEAFGNDHAESFKMLESDQAAAFVMDDNLLAGLIASSAAPKDYEILPQTLNTEPIAIMLRKGDPAFKALVDQTVKAMMASGEVGRLYAKWFLSPIPPMNAALNFPMSPVLASLIKFPGDDPAEAFRPEE